MSMRKVLKLLVAAAVAFAPSLSSAFASSGAGRVNAQMLSLEEMQNEFGANGGGGGETPPVEQAPPRLVDVYWTTNPYEVDAWVRGYSDEKTCTSPSAVSVTCSYSVTKETSSTYSVSGSFSQTYTLNGGGTVRVLSISGSTQGGFTVNGSYTANSRTSVTVTQTLVAAGYHTFYFRYKYRVQRLATPYSAMGLYSDGSIRSLGGGATVYSENVSSIDQSRKCDNRIGWCSAYN